MNENLRQTGRTTRMLEEACQRAAEGFAVYIVVHDRMYRKQIERRVEETWRRRGHRDVHGIKVETLEMLGEEHWDWKTLRIERAHPNSLFFVDHVVLELKVRQLHRTIENAAQMIGLLYPKTV